MTRTVIFFFLTISSLLADTKSFFSVHSQIASFEIERMEIFTRYSDLPRQKAKIRKQIKFLIGSLNSFEAGFLWGLSQFEILETHRIHSRQYKLVYHLKAQVSWPSEVQIPAEIPVILPRNTSTAFLKSFHKRYVKDPGPLSACLGHHSTRVTTANHFYHYRPYDDCLAQQRKSDFAYATAKMNPIKQMERPFADTEKLWEDKKLEVLISFGRDKAASNDPNDHGAIAYENFLQKVRKKWGKPDFESHRNQGPMVWEYQLSRGRKLKMIVLLIDQVSANQAELMDALTSLSDLDLFFFGGHSRLGKNFEQALRLVDTPLKVIQGCDSASYYTDPQSSPGRDIIANATPSYFSSNAPMAFHLLDSLVTTRKRISYKNILQGFDKLQRSMVIR